MGEHRREHKRRVRAHAQPCDAHPIPTFEELYRDHADFVWRAVLRMGILEAQAEDAAHEVFLVARRKLPEFRGDAAVRTWLYAITRGVCANLRRARARRERRLRALEQPLPPPDLDEHLAHQDAASFVEQFLEQLPESQREVFVMSDIEAMQGPDVAATLSIPLGTVYSRLRLARKRFETALRQRRAREQT